MASTSEEKTPIDLYKVIDYPFTRQFGFGRFFDFKDYFTRELKPHLFLLIEGQNISFVDVLFNKKEHNKLVSLYRIFEESLKLSELDEESLEHIKILSSRYFSNIQYARQMEYDPATAWDNSLKVRMSAFVNFTTKKKNAFFDELIEVLQDTFDHPNGKMPDEVKSCFVHLDRLNDELLDDFVEYLLEQNADLSENMLKDASLPNRIFQVFESKKTRVDSDQSHHQDCSHDENSEHSIDQEYSEYVSEDPTVIKDRFFREDQWLATRQSIILGALNSQPDAVSEDIFFALDELANYANEELEKEGKSSRVKAGRQKYNELVSLFDEFGKISSNSSVEAMTAARDILVKHLEKDPKDSELLKNRGGFFGAYNTFSKIYNRLGLLHYSYRKQDGTKRVAVSTTDHLLMQLLDAMNDQLNAADHSVEVSAG